MKRLPDIVKYLNLDSVGEITEQTYKGAFRVKVILTHSERFAIERLYKAELPDDKGVEQEISLRLASICELEVRLVEAPKWWIDSRNGRDLADKQPIYDLMVLLNEKFQEWKAELNGTVAPKPGETALPDSESAE